MLRVYALLALLTIISPLVLAEPVHWLSYEAALARASSARRLVYVYFYSETCYACRLMEKVFEDPRVSEKLNTLFLPARVNVAERTDIASAYRVPATPAHLFICPNGSPLGGALGYRDPERFLELLSLAQNESKRRCPDLEASESTRGTSSDHLALGLGTVIVLPLLLGFSTPFSPCILPLLPVVYLIASKGGKRGATLFTLGLFIVSALVGTVAAGLILAARSLAEPLAYMLLLFAGVVLLVDQLNRGLSQVASRLATRLSKGVRRANPFLLGSLTTIMWGPCAAPMFTAALSLASLARSPMEAAAASVSYAAGLSLTVLVLTLLLRRVRIALSRARTLNKLNKVLGAAMVAAAVLYAAGLI
ncbi:MAG: cytochrome c biogenesis protein CcdA [Thermofilaceae archaeon]